jgi:hypothetical protein
MNPYLLIFCFLSVVITTDHYCMNKKIPKIYRDLDWKQDIHDLRDNNNLTQAEFNTYLNQILDYAVVEYENEKGVLILSEKERGKLKTKLYRDTINGK